MEIAADNLPVAEAAAPRKLEEDVPVAQVVSAAAVFPAVLPLLRAQSARDGMAFADGQILTKNTFPRAGTIRPPFSSVRVQGKRSPDISPQGETRI